MIQNILYLIICGILFIATASEADNKTITVSAKTVVSDDITLGQAKMNVINQARALAIEKAAGITTTRFTVLTNQLLVADYIKTFMRGFIVDEKVLSWSSAWVEQSKTSPGLPVIEVTMQATVKPLPSNFVRKDVIKATINKKTFQDGDELKINLKAFQDIYLLVANYTSEGKVVPIFPNQFSSKNYIKAGSEITIPSQNSNAPLYVKTFPSHQQDTEAVFVIGLPANKSLKNYAWSNKFKPGKELTYASYFKTLSEIPADWMAEQVLVYSVSKN